ncbi:MAG: hypothetical protein ACOXZW_02240 [Bacilli bacterium]|jgi:hypothetical protein|nr:hypothetical protein [Bacilli bacterium]
MKKVLSIILLIFLITGCGKLTKTPTNEVENFLSRYQTLDQQVMNQLNDVVKGEPALNTSQKTAYTKLMRRQYQNLTYDIKDEIIDGDNAIVTAEIEVYDLNKTINDAQQYLNNHPNEFMGDDKTYSEPLFFDYRLGQMSKEKERVTYTLNLSLTKRDSTWVMDDLTETDREKIHGLYNY